MTPALLALLLALSGGARQEPAASNAALDRALATVRPEALAADLAFLADPVLGGRGTPSPELEIAARFVEARARRLGLAPGSVDGYQVRYALRGRRLRAASSGGTVHWSDGRTVALEFGTDLFLRTRSELVPADLRAPLVGIGDGSRAALAELGPALSGHWALVVDRGRGTAGIVRRVMEAGAAGALVVPATDDGDTALAERFGPSTAELREPRYESPMAAPPAEAAGPPVVQASRESLLRMARESATTFDALTVPGARAPFELHLRLAVEETTATAPNVAALWPGSDPERRGELLVLCAHLDHLGTDAEGTVFPGADDNASGSVALLALAEALVARGAYRRSVLFLWVSGEESGLWGSAAWCDRPRLPPELRPVAAFNLDMVGRDEPQELWLTPTAEHREHNALAALVPGLAPLEGFTELVSQDNYWSASDHFSFATRLRLPVVYLSSGEHDDYHRPTDTADRIDHGKLVRLVRLHLRLLEAAEGSAL